MKNNNNDLNPIAAGHKLAADHPRLVRNRQPGSPQDWLWWLAMVLMVIAFIIAGCMWPDKGA